MPEGGGGDAGITDGDHRPGNAPAGPWSPGELSTDAAVGTQFGNRGQPVAFGAGGKEGTGGGAEGDGVDGGSGDLRIGRGILAGDDGWKQKGSGRKRPVGGSADRDGQ